MHSCCLCKKKLQRENGTFFGVPKDERRRKIWSEVCRMKFSANSRICEDHFLSSDIIRGSKKAFLLPNSVPTIQFKQSQNKNSRNLFCVMGCPSVYNLYKFPSRENNSERRNLWLDFFNKEEPNIEDVFACDRHFSNAQIIEKGIRLNAVPDLTSNINVDTIKTTENTQNFVNTNVMRPQLQDQPHTTSIKSISCTVSTQTNIRNCGSVQASDFADEFRFVCFYCPEVYPLVKWKNFVNHLKKKHFEREEAFKIYKYVSKDHDYTPINLPPLTPLETSAKAVGFNTELLSPFLSVPMETTHNKFESVKRPLHYTSGENRTVFNNILKNNNLIEAKNSSCVMTISGMQYKLDTCKNKTTISPLAHCSKNVKNKLIKNKYLDENSTNGGSVRVISSGILHLRDSKRQVSRKTALSRCLKRAHTIKVSEQKDKDAFAQPTEIAFEYTPQEIVDLLLDYMKNYPVLWQFNDEPFNEDFYLAVEDMCKVINDKWLLNIDNLKMRRSINRILRFYCYLFPNENVENIDRFTNFYDKCASFLPSSANEIAYARCSHCYLCYRNDFDLKRHLLEEQKYLQWPYKCVQCKECFRESDEYEFHKRLPHYDEIFRCQPCNKTFNRRNIYNKHIAIHHPKDSNKRVKYVCNICGKVFKTSGNLNSHKIYHGERKYKCNLCPKSYFVNAKLALHLKSHRKEYNLMCEVCGKGFILQANLREHMKKHTGAKVTCNICNLKLRKSSLMRHLRLVHVAYEGTVETTYRAKNYHYKSLLRPRTSHAYRKTSNEKIYHCKICKVNFENYKLIVAHNKQLHSEIQWSCKMCCTEFRHKVFKLVDQNEDLNEVLAIKTEQLDKLAESFDFCINGSKIVTKSKDNTTSIKSDIISEQIYFEAEKIQSSTMEDELMLADNNVVTQEIKIDYVNDFFTDL